MSLTYNGTTIQKIIYNGTELTKLIFNGTEVWTSASWHTVWSGSSSLSSNTLNFYSKIGTVCLYIDGYYSDTYTNSMNINPSTNPSGSFSIQGIRYSLFFPEGAPDDIGTIRYQIYTNDDDTYITGISITFTPIVNTYTATLKSILVYY